MTSINPWTVDIIRVLWDAPPYGITKAELDRRLWALRGKAGVKPPKKFSETVQSTLNHHTDQSAEWRKNGARQEDALFYSPRGKYSGTWAVHHERAVVWPPWVAAKPSVTGGPDPVRLLAMEIARELISSARSGKKTSIAQSGQLGSPRPPSCCSTSKGRTAPLS